MNPTAARTICLLAVLLAVPSPGAAQKPTAIRLVPAPSWRLTSTQQLELNAVEKWGGDPAIEREYGVKSIERRIYQLEDKSAEVISESAPDASAAYGLFTFYQTRAATPVAGVPLAAHVADATLMARGRLFVRLPHAAAAGSALSDADIHKLLVFLAGAWPLADPQANLPAPLPPAGLVPGSERYLLGLEAARRVLPSFRTDLIGFSQGAEVQTAAYEFGSDRATLAAISYPTPHIARVRFGAMEHFLGVNQDHGAGSLYGQRHGSFVFLALDASSSAAAAKLLDEFKVSQAVSWDERYPGDESIFVQLAKLILGNLALVGILIGMAILGGVLIFISRRLAAKWFPESQWGQPDEEGIIRLKLS